ncbi:MAG: DUF885 domain-containing protein [Chloroflexota bacterium]|nr:DUF885 domain-containing protein [Chloroflexota bacterium]
MDDLSRTYVELAHAIEQHNPGYIDGYYGPEEWKVNERWSLPEVARRTDDLATIIAGLQDEERRAFLAAQVRALQTTVALLRGEQIPYTQEVRLLYDVEAEHVPEKGFEEALATIDALLPGRGSLAAREQMFREQFEVAPERLPALLDAIMQELRRRTCELFELPEGESFVVQLVENEPWGAYNWYLGNYRSRIDINTDLPIYLTELPDLIAHEAYPGHHTEHAIKECHLFQELGRGEHSILLINAPECVVSEGIATRARQIVISDEALREWLVDDLTKRAGLHDAPVETMLQIREAKKELRGVTGNAALLLYEGGASDEEILRYIQRYRLATAEEACKSLQFMTHPNFRSYLFTYTRGGELLDQLFERGEAINWFGRLLHEPVTPSTIRGWLGNAAS